MLKLKVINSSSKGNCYVLSNNDIEIMLDCGYKNIKYNFEKVKAILITHYHMDHIGAIPKIKDFYNGYYYGCRESLDILPILKDYKIEVKEYEQFNVENFIILPFEVQHDAKNINYLIKDKISNLKILYMTDIGNINDFEFKDVDIFIVESNWIDDNVDYEDMKIQRLIKTHSSLQETSEFLVNNININTKYIFLIHISRSIEDYKYMENYIKEKINNKNIKVIAINPKLKNIEEFILQEEINIDFD